MPKAINVQQLTTQAEAARRPIQQFREQVKGMQAAQRTELRSDPGYTNLRKTVTSEFTELAAAMQDVGISPQDALRDAGIKTGS